MFGAHLVVLLPWRFVGRSVGRSVGLSVCLSVCLSDSCNSNVWIFFQKTVGIFLGRFRKVYWSVPFVCLSVCYFAKVNDFSQSILVSTVCYFAKVNDFSQSILVSTVCLSVCLSVCHTSYRPQFGTDQDYFVTVDSAYPHIDTKLFLKKSAKGQGQGYQKPWKQLFES